jgi:membrane-associated phospholipid phosphatase
MGRLPDVAAGGLARVWNRRRDEGRTQVNPAELSGGRLTGEDSRAKEVLIRVIVVYAVAYATLAAFGAHTFIFKSVLVPAFAIYAIASSETSLFIRSWFPFLAATACFDALRGAIFALVRLGYRPVLWEYPIEWERALLGTPAASLPLQETWRSFALDRVMVTIHGFHFVYFLMFGLVLWHARRDWFARYKWAMICTFYLGGLVYLLAPTAPPWLASNYGLLPPVEHIAGLIYNVTLPELSRAYDTNPVAAMPSLHAAFPTTCMVIAWAAFSRPVAIAASIYAAAVSFSIVYLGEHYFVDVLGGYLLSAVACVIAFRVVPRPEPPSLSSAVVRSAILIVISVVLAFLSAR